MKFALLGLTFLLLLAMTAEPRSIAFERDNGIWVAGLDGSNARKVADGNLPEISPDGARVAFNSDEASTGSPVRHIIVVDVTSGKTTVMKAVPSNNSFGPVWSPDGKSLLFETFMDGDWQLALINADGTGYRIIMKAQAKDKSYYAPCWAPDGKTFYSHDLDWIYQCDLQGNVIKKWPIRSIAANGDMNSNSRMIASEDGKSLIVDLDMDEDNNRDNWDGPPPAVWVVDLATGKGTRATGKGNFAWDPFWAGANEFLYASQGASENRPSIYRGSTSGGRATLLIKDGRMPSVSR